MSNEIVLKKGDTLPIRELELQEEDSNGDRVQVDLTGGSVDFDVYDPTEDKMIIDGSSVTVTDAGNGLIEYEWKDSDVQEEGSYEGEFVVTYADGERTFPGEGFLPVKIADDIQDSQG